jgi:apolipoprotein N-acyltransferase
MVNLLGSGLSGALLFASFKPFGLWWLAPLAISIHIWVINRSNKKIASALTFAAVFNLLLLHWTSIYVGSLPWIVLVAGMSMLYLPLALVSRWGIASYPLIFIAMEEIRNRFPFGGFGWSRLAYSQADGPLAILARYGGAVFVTASVCVFALFLFFLTSRNMKPLLIAPLILVFIPYSVTANGSTSVLMIQGNVPNYGLDFNSRAKAVFANHVNQTRVALQTVGKPDVILWPENAVDVDPFKNKEVFAELESFDEPLIVGAIVERDQKLLNTSILWQESSKKIYVKQHLTPFGEYIPLRTIASFISPLTDRVRDFSAGNTKKIFTIGQAKIAPIICYEILDDALMRKAAQGSNILMVQTNNATFGTSAQSDQQLSITKIRAIEHAKNVASVSTTGFSAVIDYRGSVVQQTQMGKAQSLFAEIELLPGVSPRDRLGTWALVLTIGWTLMLARRYRYRR